MDARREAWERIDARYDPRVLEPSPPYVPEPPWFADDPVAPGPGPSETVVSPVGNTGLSWSELVAAEPDLGDWCAERWLAAWPRLEAPPASFPTTRLALHSLAEHVLAPARRSSNGKIGLRFTRAGFGTPFFGAGKQARVEGSELVVDHGGWEERAPLSTLQEAAAFVGIECGARPDLYEPTTPLYPEETLHVDETAARWLGEWFGFGCSVLEQLRAEVHAAGKPSRVQLWPEHFDMAVELNDPTGAHRAGYGISPGEDEHEDPYLYVVPWSPCDDDWWNASHFDGALLDLKVVLDASDQRAMALDFFRTSRRVLGETGAGS